MKKNEHGFEHQNEDELLAACRQIEGMTFGQIASFLHVKASEMSTARKGWVGCAIERLLGADGGCLARPDFLSLGIELKTLPINRLGKPAESTFVTKLSLLNLHRETWETSTCWAKLKRVLWVPVESDKSIHFLARRVGRAFLWSPDLESASILQRDWLELTSLIVLGRLDAVSAHLGEYLQIRPKAAHGRALSESYDEFGQVVCTLPRGFYLRPSFTEKIYTLCAPLSGNS